MTWGERLPVGWRYNLHSGHFVLDYHFFLLRVALRWRSAGPP